MIDEEKPRRKDHETNKQNKGRLDLALTLTAAIASILVVAISFLSSPFSLFERGLAITEQLAESTELMAQQLAVLTEKQRAFDNFLESYKDISEEEAVSLQIAQIDSQVQVLNEKIGVIEKGVAVDPERAFSIPFLRRDVDELRASVESIKASTRVEIDRLVDLLMWTIGTIGVGLFSLALGHFLRTK